MIHSRTKYSKSTIQKQHPQEGISFKNAPKWRNTKKNTIRTLSKIENIQNVYFKDTVHDFVKMDGQILNIF